MKQRNYRIIMIIAISLTLVLIAMLFIFLNSAKNGTESGSQSGKIAAFLQAIFYRRELNAEEATHFESLLRTSGHYSDFVLLGLAVGLLVATICRCERQKWFWFGFGWLGCIIYAMTDEWHQMFVPGRAAEWKDVLVDSTGALTGILIMLGLMLTIGQKVAIAVKKPESAEKQNS